MIKMRVKKHSSSHVFGNFHRFENERPDYKHFPLLQNIELHKLLFRIVIARSGIELQFSIVAKKEE